jgi:serine/tyrosine/threonine adenylyltransferase
MGNFTARRDITCLGSAFYDVVSPARFPQTILRYRNNLAATTVGLEDLSDADWIEYFGKFKLLPGSLAAPLALKYHGHQFRTYNPDIGDGRGFLYGQCLEINTNRLLDFGTKGSGQTPYSRSGDGRLTLKGGVREVLATEMLTALGVNTSKTFSLIETGENLERHDEPSPTRSAVLVRLSHSHIRFGSFQRLAYFQQAAEMHQLIDYCVQHLIHPTLDATPAEQLLDCAIENACTLAASYMAAGFVHGVLNTDNINITGESFDYGPYRFAPTYDLGFTAAYFDHGGLYAFGRQAEALHWNIYQLAKSLLLITPQEKLVPILETFPARFEAALSEKICKRLGIVPHHDTTENLALLGAMESALQQSQVSLPQFYFDWYGGTCRHPVIYSPIFDEFRRTLDGFTHLPCDHEYFKGDAPCGLLIDEIETIWSAIDKYDDWDLFNQKINSIREMKEALL